jgi:hypothetical protein
MKNLMTRPLRTTACVAGLLCAVAGCGNGRSAVPPEDQSRQALEGALKTWRDGGAPGAIAGAEPPVQVFDTPWSQGARLGSYEIVQADTTNAERRFTVRLALTRPDRVQEVQYYVLGQSPLLVFRDEDYRRNVNMEDGPKLVKTGRSRRPSRR